MQRDSPTSTKFLLGLLWPEHCSEQIQTGFDNLTVDMLEPSKRSKELDGAVYDDWKHKQVDDAKKRAVAQHVDYETFKNMVSVAHLKPIGAEGTRTGTLHA